MSIGRRASARTAGRPASCGRSSSSPTCRSGPRAPASSRSGDTHVLCAATIEDRIPPHLRGKGTGWVTAEYTMLPRATSERTPARVGQGSPGRPDDGDPAARRTGAARGRRHRQARRAHRHHRLRRAAGRRRHAHRLDHRRLRRAGPGAPHASARRRRSSARSQRSASASWTARRCSTSTTRRTRAPRSTSTSSAPTRATTSRSRARPRASPSTAGRWTGCWPWPTTACAALRVQQGCSARSEPAPAEPPAPGGAWRIRGACRVAGRHALGATSWPSCASCSTCRASSSSRLTTSASPANRSRTAPRSRQRHHQGALVRPRPGCPRSPTTRASRSMRSAAGRASGRGVSPARHATTKRTTPSSWPSCSWAGSARDGGAPATAACSPSWPRPEPSRSSRGTLVGRIAIEPRGSGGFGYDPIFEPAFEPPGGRTVGQLSQAEKNAVSHRAKAAAAMGDAVRQSGC